MKFIDSHCHLDMEPLVNEYESAIERAYKLGVETIINVGASLRGSRASIEIANKYPNIWASIGIHPHEAEVTTNVEDAINSLRLLMKNDKVVAIGEIGLDYFYLENENLKVPQKNIFEAQIKLAIEQKKPVIIHTRDADNDMLKILNKYHKELVGGVIHCYSGDSKFVKKLLDLGFYIGFTGFITFEQSKFDHIREAVKVVPLEKILIETDAPFLAPEPFRGKTNEPAHVVEVAKKISELKGIGLTEVAEITFKNTKNLFKLR